MELLKSARRRALKLGALFPLRNQIFFLWDSVLEINFELRVAEILTKKVSADNSLAFQKNPFLPYDSELYICDLGNSHVCLLNKYSVVKNHILVVTKNYRHQSDSLTQDDIEAWKMGIKMLKGIGFFNCGPESGASQPHKHFQVIPGKSELINELYSQGVKDGDTINKHPKLKFKHGYICFKETEKFSEYLLHLIYKLLKSLDIAVPTTNGHIYSNKLGYLEGFQSFNIILTEKLILLVKRSRHSFSYGKSSYEVDISVNALGFAGFLLAKDEREAQVIKEVGLLRILRGISCFEE